MRSWAAAPDESVAILGLPTGYGKSELIALAPFLFASRRTLVIAPSVVVRAQLAERIEKQEHLRKKGIVPKQLPHPRVKEHVGIIDEPADWALLEPFDVVVSHTQSVSPTGGPVADPPDPNLFDLILFDEAHHLGAPSWTGVRIAFPGAAAVGFTATPYRRDRRALPGRTIFQYPIGKAVEEKFFVPISYRLVKSDASVEGRDKAVATEAIAELRRRDVAGHAAARLLVRADTVQRAETLQQLYTQLDSGVQLEVITHQTSPQELSKATERLKSGQSSGVAFVGVLGEGFDLPSLKIAAYHNPHRSLPVTIQFAGRVARTESADAVSAPEEHAVLIAAADDHPEILAELHKDGQQWDQLIPDLAKDFTERPTRAWTASSPDTVDMAAAFSVENFQTFLLADVYRTSTTPDYKVLGEKLADLRILIPPPAEEHGEGLGVDDSPDTAASVKVIQHGTCYGVLLLREHQRPWLQWTPPGQPEYEHFVLAIEKHVTDESWWLCIRSTLPPSMTQQVMAALFDKQLERPTRTHLAQYRSDLWPTARFTGLGKRAIHPVVAGMLSYETGAGRNVDQAVTLDDRALHEAGHAIGVVPLGPGSRQRLQIGIAMDSRRVWQTGYASLKEYADWAASICRDLERETPVSQLGGLRVADGALSPTTKPIAALLDPRFDQNWDAEFVNGTETQSFHELDLVPAPRARGGDVGINLMTDGSVVGTVIYATDGQLLSALGEFRRVGQRERLSDRLERLPISVFFDDGSVLRGPGGCVAPLGDEGYFAVSDKPLKLSASLNPVDDTNRVAVLDPQIVLLPEKDGSSTKAIFDGVTRVTRSTSPASLFQFVVRQARRERADFIYCDDGKGEVADFIIAWRSRLPQGRPHILLVHCKAMAAAERARVASGAPGVKSGGLKEAEEVSQQCLRSVAFLLRPPQLMLSYLQERAGINLRRYVHGSHDDITSIVSNNPLGRTSDIWIVHPGMSHKRLTEQQGRPLRALLGAVRARAVGTGTDIAVFGRD
jgi:superfamily II DNA or RNA helicase